MKSFNLLKNGVHYLAINKTFQGLTLGTLLGSMATMIWVSKTQCSSSFCFCSCKKDGGGDDPGR